MSLSGESEYWGYVPGAIGRIVGVRAVPTAARRLDVLRRQALDTEDTWFFTVRDLDRNLAYDCSVDVRTAMACSDATWWAERGNPGMALYEAVLWAENRAREMGMREMDGAASE